jgi:SAM-dependent methyltransferase
MSKLKIIIRLLKNKGFHAVVILFQNKFFPYIPKPIKKPSLYLDYFKDRKGIEIGGPSRILAVEIPIYQVMESLDGCNFSRQTVWEGNIVEGNNYNYFKDNTGVQYICEASDLQPIPDEKYDFLVAVHCLEHCANTLKTVEEWLRVVKKGGAILLVLPDRRYTFDRKRPITTFEHFLDDYSSNINETDLTHLDEIIKHHDLNRDVKAGSKEQFLKRSLDNYNNICLHHHVFDFKSLNKIFNYLNVKVIDKTFSRPYHQIIMGIKQ